MPERVHLRRQFAALKHPTSRGRSGPIRLSFVESPDPAAVAYAIGRDVGNAVVRNRVRRRLRAIVEELSPRLTEGFYLVKCGVETPNLTYDELRNHLNRAIDGVQRG